MLPAQRAELQKGRVSMRTGNLPLTKTIRSSHANHEASSIDIVQQQRKFGKVNLRQLLSSHIGREVMSYALPHLIGVFHRFFHSGGHCSMLVAPSITQPRVTRIAWR